MNYAQEAQNTFVDSIKSNSIVRKDSKSFCSYCENLIYNEEFLCCVQCQNNVHIKCLKNTSTPGDLHGDVFFDMTCAKCVGTQRLTASTSTEIVREEFVRQQLPWLMIITLALYNLSIKSFGLSHHGYFHWRSHISNFIDKNWDCFFQHSSRRRKNWIGSITGALSHNSPKFFLSGQEVFKENGWWKLAYSNCTPKQIYKKYEKLCRLRQKKRNEKRAHEDDSNSSDLSNSSTDLQQSKKFCADPHVDALKSTVSCSRTLPYMGRKTKNAKPTAIKNNDEKKTVALDQTMSTVQSSLMDFLAESLGGDDLSMFSNLPNIVPETIGDSVPLIDTQSEHQIPLFDAVEPQFESLGLNSYENISNVLMNGKMNDQFPYYESSDKNVTHLLDADEDSFQDSLEFQNLFNEDAEYQPRILKVTNYQSNKASNSNNDILKYNINSNTVQKIDNENNNEFNTDESDNEDELNQTDSGNISTKTKNNKENEIITCQPSLFTKEPRRNFPWLVFKKNEEFSNNEEDIIQPHQSLTLMSLYEEKELLRKYQKVFSLEMKCQLKIPTYIRRFYRKLCIRDWKRSYSKSVFNIDNYLLGKNVIYNEKENIIDRYQLLTLTSNERPKTFYARIAGSVHYELFKSPYSQRTLHPFIYQNKICMPPMLKLLCEIQYTVNGALPERNPIDYCYVRPNHIAAVNALLEAEFWPGIDMTECLSYPDYSVVVLYKKLVIGCGFLVPDVGYNEAYISFMAVRPGWQRSGIGSFMLYHLIQTCMDKDITLHVSATNPAVVLYQKFGFKIEEVIIDFYDKYLPIDSPHSRNAFLLRLMR